jgi:hypothetical protein
VQEASLRAEAAETRCRGFRLRRMRYQTEMLR